MTQERELHPDLRAMLMSGEPFQYAHLIKFERPSRPDSSSGKVSTSAQRYTYITDGSRDIKFDDGSLDLSGNPNGEQNYIANKVLKVSDVSEATEAKASNFSIVLDGNGLGATATEEVTITAVDGEYWDIAWPSNIDLISQGFREGDKVTLSIDRTGDFNIYKFRENNTVRVKKVDDDLTIGTALVQMNLASEEVISILQNKNSEDYASFIHREVFIYKAYYKDGNIVGAPIALFKGIISNSSFDDDEQGIKVTWGLTSHWGDFSQVRGRITSDDFHRALDQNGNPQPLSAIKPIYAYDKGFAHAETSINLLSTYSVQVEKQDIKVKKGFLGIFGNKVKVKKYMVPEDRHTQLDFQLAAKALPVIYGVKNTVGMPIFADTLLNDSSTVFVAYALGEGEMGGIYDVIVDGKSLICNDKSDFDSRNTQGPDNTVQVICRGRADRGDVLGGVNSIAPVSQSQGFYDNVVSKLSYSLDFNLNELKYYRPYIPPVVEAVADEDGKGIVHGESISLTSPIDMTLDFFSGLPGQKASSQLVEVAKANNFKVQNSYWLGEESAEYWSPNHRLLDTSYILAKYKISEGETSIPELEFILRGRVLDCYNYDYSYAHDAKSTNDNPNNFPLGSMVRLINQNGTPLNGNREVQIIDKWTFARPDGVIETRFRFSEIPELGYDDGIPSITRFYMLNAASQTWYMTTFNHIQHSGSVASELIVDATETTVNGEIALQYPTNTDFSSGGDPAEPSPIYSFLENNPRLFSGDYSEGRLLTGYIVS